MIIIEEGIPFGHLTPKIRTRVIRYLMWQGNICKENYGTEFQVWIKPAPFLGIFPRKKRWVRIGIADCTVDSYDHLWIKAQALTSYKLKNNHSAK